ncbi:MAG: hypothetical protein U0703_02190 [Anaerolineae bacterium]
MIGVLCVANHKTLTKAEAELLSQLAVPAAISLHNAQLLDDQQYQINTLSHSPHADAAAFAASGPRYGRAGGHGDGERSAGGAGGGAVPQPERAA